MSARHSPATASRSRSSGSSRSRPDGATLMVAKADGTGQRALTGPLEPYSMSWSPTSDAIALISATPGQDRVLSVISTEPGVEPVTISMSVEPQGTVEWRPPAGDELIFEGFDHGSFRHAIYSVHPDGTSFHPITAPGGTSDFFGPYEFTPDGRLMTFTDGDPISSLRVLDLETGEARPFGAALPEPEDWDGRPIASGTASMLPDGKTIVFGRYWNPDGTEINHQLWAASIADDGATAVPIGPVHRSRRRHEPVLAGRRHRTARASSSSRSTRTMRGSATRKTGPRTIDRRSGAQRPADLATRGSTALTFWGRRVRGRPAVRIVVRAAIVEESRRAQAEAALLRRARCRRR